MNEKGVTIIELLIATAIFSVVLLIVIYGFFYVTSDYIKGFVLANTQETAVAIENQVTSDIELNGGGVYVTQPASDGSHGICIGDHRYSYDLNNEYVIGTRPGPGVDTMPHGLVVDTVSNCNGATTAQPVTELAGYDNGSEELLGDNMRLGAFSITPDVAAPGLFTVDVTVAYGSNNAFSSITGSGPYSYYCASIRLGENFCAVSTLQKVVQQQISGNT